MAKRKVFISYDYVNDRHYKNLLLAWDSNKQFDFSISDYSADVSINSTKASAIKSVFVFPHRNQIIFGGKPFII